MRFVGEVEFVNCVAAQSASGNYGRAKRCDCTGRDHCARILQGPDVALYRLALPAPRRQPGAGFASGGYCASDDRGGNAGTYR